MVAYPFQAFVSVVNADWKGMFGGQSFKIVSKLSLFPIHMPSMYLYPTLTMTIRYLTQILLRK